MVSQSATRDADAYYRYYGRPDRITINQARKGEDIGPDREGGNPSGSRTSIQDVRAAQPDSATTPATSRLKGTEGSSKCHFNKLNIMLFYMCTETGAAETTTTMIRSCLVQHRPISLVQRWMVIKINA